MIRVLSPEEAKASAAKLADVVREGGRDPGYALFPDGTAGATSVFFKILR